MCGCNGANGTLLRRPRAGPEAPRATGDGLVASVAQPGPVSAAVSGGAPIMPVTHGSAVLALVVAFIIGYAAARHG